MARATNLKIIATDAGVVCDVKMENLSGRKPRTVAGVPIEIKADGSPKLKYKDHAGNELSFTNMLNGQPVMTDGRGYVDEHGQLQDPIPYMVLEDGTELVAEPRPKTEVYEIKGWMPEGTENSYLIEKVYQIRPSQGTSKKDVIRNQTKHANTAAMKKLYDYMVEHGVVAKAVCNVSSTGKLDYVGFLKAVDLGTQWTMEMVIAKQEKEYAWMEEKNFQAQAQQQQQATIKNNINTVDAL